MNPHLTRMEPSHPISRPRLLSLLNAALGVQEYRFVRQVALTWLAIYPGDLMVQFLLAQSFIGDQKSSQARPILEKLCQVDPEFVEAAEWLSRISIGSASKTLAADYLSQSNLRHAVKASQKALVSARYEDAETITRKTLVEFPDSPLPAIEQLRIALKKEDMDTLQNLAMLYHQRWPECIQFSLFLAEALLVNGDETGAVALLHQCATRDATGQVACRIWGEDHPYRPLWAEHFSMIMDIPIPAAVARLLGMNQLVAGEAPLPEDEPVLETPATEAPVMVEEAAETPPLESASETAAAAPVPHYAKSRPSPFQESIEKEFADLARRIKQPTLARMDGRFPIYVIFSTRRGLEAAYGDKKADVEAAMTRLAETVRQKPGWGAFVYLADDASSLAELGLKPVPPTDPWKLKLSLTDLDQALAKKGEMIGALLIVGGPQVIPFHHLPNPTDDMDANVPSDNPYATLDDNYFIPEWPVGRLPGDGTRNPAALINSLDRITSSHKPASKRAKGASGSGLSILDQLYQMLMDFLRQTSANRVHRSSLGYTAEIWTGSSVEVFKTIKDGRPLLVCPPAGTGRISQPLTTELAYFNLHGIEDSPEWFGQKDPASYSNEPDYPVALTPSDLSATARSPRFIFSEACYGGHIEGKNSPDEALSLKFLNLGAEVFIGSTCTAYGAVTPPITSADLLADAFWQQLNQGQNAGSAFMQAKISLAREMNRRQGYLDAEDQKTLLSFVLYGDPLCALPAKSPAAKSVLRLKFHPRVKTVVEEPNSPSSPGEVPAEILSQVRKSVDRYLPGWRDADVTLTRQVCDCASTNLACSSCQVSKKGFGKGASQRMVVTLAKQVHIGSRASKSGRTHTRYARMTLDRQGKILKVSVSR
ncbi:MAG TPA: C25 family cysteine peptidase [Anaerolineaceae bacterium]|nr:C25 family cysteine peptidase [Anaerolineaceae bacterium]HPN52963.1 C25 family cysteine peptidase [Anaerolineaceae bacterium]